MVAPTKTAMQLTNGQKWHRIRENEKGMDGHTGRGANRLRKKVEKVEENLLTFSENGV